MSHVPPGVHGWGGHGRSRAVPPPPRLCYRPIRVHLSTSCPSYLFIHLRPPGPLFFTITTGPREISALSTPAAPPYPLPPHVPPSADCAQGRSPSSLGSPLVFLTRLDFPPDVGHTGPIRCPRGRAQGWPPQFQAASTSRPPAWLSPLH